MRNRELEIYKQVIHLVDEGVDAEELKWWAVAKIKDIEWLEANKDAITRLTARPSKPPPA